MKPAPEFPRPLAVDGITPGKTRAESIKATQAECAALAQRLDLRSISGLKADLALRRVPGGTTIHVSGSFEAEVVQTCAVSLRPVPSLVRGSFDTYFSEEIPAPDAEIELSADESEDSAEIVENGHIDLGEVVTQYLSLELDPYPRAPGVTLPAQMTGTGADGKRNPFKVLEELKGKKT